MANLFSLITHTKVAKIVLPGEPRHSSPLALAEGLFIFLNYFSKKAGFLNVL